MNRSAMIRLSDRSAGRDNNLNLLRLLAAVCVMISHSFPISHGVGTPEPLSHTTGASLGSHAVTVFFIISGFLVTASFMNSRTLWQWTMARVFRIFPGLLAVLALAALVIGPVATSLPLAEYFQTPQTWLYVPLNIKLFAMKYGLPGVFSGNPYPEAVNGSLWSLRFEVECYVLLAIGGLCGVIKRPAWAVAILVLAFLLQIEAVRETATFIAPDHLSTLFRLGSAFAIGSAAWVLRERILLDWRILVLLATFAAFAKPTAAFQGALLFALAYGVAWFAYVPDGRIRQFNRLGDYSYGTYLFAFPVQQLIAWRMPELDWFQSLPPALALTGFLAIASWHLVEKPGIALGKRAAAPGSLRAASRPAQQADGCELRS